MEIPASGRRPLWQRLDLANVGSRDIQIETTSNSESPLLNGGVVLIALDMWEHAYYLDHQDRRSEYVRTFPKALVDWVFANCNLIQAVMGSPSRQAPADRKGGESQGLPDPSARPFLTRKSPQS